MKANRSRRTAPGTRRLSPRHEALEPRLPLAADLQFSAPPLDQAINEDPAATIDLAFEFTDSLSVAPGDPIGLDPGNPDFAYVALGGVELRDFGVDGSASASELALSFTIDTGDPLAGTAPTITFDGQTYTGDIAGADVGNGAYEIAVFKFDSFDLDAGQTITATGERPFAILSLGDITVGGVIDASAQGAQAGPGGGDGGFGGQRVSGNVVLPSDGLVAAGADGVDTQTGGAGQTFDLNTGPGVDSFVAGGGGFGGAGGSNGSTPELGGEANGDLRMGIQGGGGGAGAWEELTSGSVISFDGGGGGGGVELGALGAVTIESGGAVRADGADGESLLGTLRTYTGGGGAGGGILVHATDVEVAGTLSATGGASTSLNDLSRSGGGGGGRVLVVAGSDGLLDAADDRVDVSGGLAGNDNASPSFGQAGQAGVFERARVPDATTADDYFFTVERLDGLGNWVTWLGLEDVPVTAVTPDGMGGLTGSVELTGLSDSLFGDDGLVSARVRLTDSQPTPNSVVSGFTVTVDNVAPAVVSAPSSLAGDEGSLLTASGAFADVPADPLTITASLGSITDDGLGGWTWTYDAPDDFAGTVTITADDSDGGLAETTFDLTVNNLAPTVTSTPGAVVGDEGSLLTASGAFADVPADLLTITASLGSITDDGLGGWIWTYDALDDFAGTVTITADDGDGGLTETTFDLTVNNLAPTLLSVATDSSVIFTESKEAGQLVTLTAAFADPGVLDTHTATVDWGDGSTAPASIDQAAGTLTATYAYPSAGFYDVTVTLVDKDSGETSQTVQTVIAGVTVQDGRLLGIGTAGDDAFKVFGVGSGYHVLSRLNGGHFDLQSFHQTIGSIDLLLGPGDDVGFVSQSVGVGAYIDGGAGDDFLTGGSGDDVLLGGAGYDLLLGRGGRDLLLGGSGGDMIVGASGDDVLISGTTSHDGSRAALDALLAEWTSGRSYAERVDNLTGDDDLSQDGLNGDTFLIAEGDLQTVFDDESTDWLLGGRGADLYFGGEDDISLARFWEAVEEIEAQAPVV
ncbi:PKD domain-containing protein [Botrimarina sp.]|uniref:PKD domain-containing protein n=1 Tax=Botrimarina sp. TaxID=2795802 RepID=UPI0032F076A1